MRLKIWESTGEELGVTPQAPGVLKSGTRPACKMLLLQVLYHYIIKIFAHNALYWVEDIKLLQTVAFAPKQFCKDYGKYPINDAGVASVSNPKILVVDDNQTVLTIVSRSLRNKGYQVITATDGEEALQIARQEHPELMVLDVVMPKKNGFQVCRSLKRADETKDIKIILLTSRAQPSDRYWGLKQGADDYMTKPFEEDELLDNVSSLL